MTGCYEKGYKATQLRAIIKIIFIIFCVIGFYHVYYEICSLQQGHSDQRDPESNPFRYLNTPIIRSSDDSSSLTVFGVGVMHDGRLDGDWTFVNDVGLLAATGSYRDGRETGIWMWYFDNGIKAVEANFNDGRESGLRREWHDNGEREAEGVVTQGEKNGEWRLWSRAGELLVRLHYAMGSRIDSFTQWDIKGRLIAEGTYSRGHRHGLWRFWRYQGGETRLQEFKFLRGFANGPYEEYSSGQLRSKGLYIDGFHNGYFYKWDERGVLREKGECIKGDRHVSVHRWSGNGERVHIDSTPSICRNPVVDDAYYFDR